MIKNLDLHSVTNTNQMEDLEMTKDDKFNLDSLRLSQDFSATVGVKKAIITIPVRKPNRQEYFRVHPLEDMCFQTAVLELKDDRETYLVDRALWNELQGEIVPKVLFATINRQGVLALWPIRLPGSDGRQDQWNQSALGAASMAKTRWIRIAANMSLGAYDVFEATGNLPDPVWPELTLQQIIEIAFKDRYITSLDHPGLRRLRGEQ